MNQRPDNLKLVDFLAEEWQTFNIWRENQIYGGQSPGSTLKYLICDAFDSKDLHYGQLLTAVVKDVITRLAHQRGFEVDRGLTFHPSVEPEALLERMGCFVKRRKNKSQQSVESIDDFWRTFKVLHSKGLIYRDTKALPYSIDCSEPMPIFECDQNIKRVTQPFVIASFPLRDRPDVSLLAWTAWPWTLTTNIALLVHPDVIYAEVMETQSGRRYIVASECISNVFSEGWEATHETLEVFRGEIMAGLKYMPLFNYFDEVIEAESLNAFHVVCDRGVQEIGTGITHSSPHLGESDLHICLQEQMISENALETFCPIDEHGRFTATIDDFTGAAVLRCQKAVITLIKAKDRVFRAGFTDVNLAYCARCDTPLITRIVTTWMLRVESLTEELRRNVMETEWVPKNISEYKLDGWLERAQPWAISGHREGGIPVPIWRGANEEEVCFGSLAELKERCPELDTTDLSQVDNAIFHSESTDAQAMHRTQDVFNTSFESALKLFVQFVPNSKRNRLHKRRFLVDCIAESIERVHSHYYKLHVLSTALLNQSPAETVVVTDIVLDSQEQKMVDRKHRNPPTSKLLDDVGADALRLGLLNSIIAEEKYLKPMDAVADEMLDSILLPLHSATNYLQDCISQGCSGYHFDHSRFKAALSEPLNARIVSRLQSLMLVVETKLNNHRFDVVIDLRHFVMELEGWYIFLCRKRCANAAFLLAHCDALFVVLMNLSTVLMPIIPFLAETIFRKLSPWMLKRDAQSVMQLPRAKVDEQLLAPHLELAFETLKIVIALGRSIRHRKHIRTEYQLSKMVIIHKDQQRLDELATFKELILSELNVQMLMTATSSHEFDFRLRTKAIFSRIGNREDFPALEKHFRKLAEREIEQRLLRGRFCSDETITMEDIELFYEQKANTAWTFLAAATDGDVLVLLNIHLSDGVSQFEAVVGEIAAYIQDMQKLLPDLRKDAMRVFYQTFVHCSDGNCLPLLESTILTHQKLIEDLIGCQFLPLPEISRLTWRIRLEERFLVNGARLKIYLCTSD